MTTCAPLPRRRASLSALVTVLMTGLLTIGGVSAVSAQEAAEPELTWAPLVTLPPIVAPPILSPVELADGFTLGDADAPVAIEVWEDFQCPFCQRFTFQVEPQIVEDYVKTGKASLTFRNLAFLGDESHWAAVASSLAADQGKFWPFHDYLFANLLGENVGSFNLERLLAIGEATGLDMDEFKAGLVLEQARERFAEIEADAREDATALGIGSTPSLVLDGKLLKFDTFDEALALIDEAVTAAEGATDETDATPSQEAGTGAGANEQPEPSPAG
jgi:protein-disulfide isomerase